MTKTDAFNALPSPAIIIFILGMNIKNLTNLTNLNNLNTFKTGKSLASKNGINVNKEGRLTNTIIKSKTFQPSEKYFLGP